MMLTQLIFYTAAAATIISSLMVILSRNPVKSALFLVSTFVATSVLWLMLQAEFLALILIFVYVGAVMTLFLFVVMMLDINIAETKKQFVRYLPIGLLVMASVIGVMFIAVGPEYFGLGFALPTEHPAEYSSIKALGSVLYTQYAYPFELAALLLLVAIIAAITLTFRGPQKRKEQSISRQVRVTKADRLRIVNIDQEGRA